MVAAFIALPLGWLLSYGASLPFFLGLFFFMLFGLIIGSAAFRIAAPRRPYGTAAILAGTTLLVCATWGVSLFKEARDFPDDVARRVSMRTRNLGDRNLHEFRGDVEKEVRAYLSDRYGPGAYWGYIRWVLTDGQIEAGKLTSTPQAVSRPAGQIRWWWALRIVASIALLAFGIASQTMLLRHSVDAQNLKKSEIRV